MSELGGWSHRNTAGHGVEVVPIAPLADEVCS